ncbi:hypothetical protein M9Y10_036400 [Tritrichomonas musculus]
MFSFLNLPINRTITSPKIQMKENFRLEPSTKIVLKENSNFYFHVFSDNEVRALFRNEKTDKYITADIISEKDTDNENIKDYEFSAPSLEKGYYKLLVVQRESYCLIEQQYFITGKLRKESKEEKKLMKELKKTIEGKNDILKDVPSSIRITVENMVEKSIKEANSNRSIEKIDILSYSYDSSFDETKMQNLEKINNDLKTQINELNETISALIKQKEEQNKYLHSLEQEKNEIESRFDELKKQIENDSKEKGEMKAKLREFEQKTNDLNNEVSKLEKRNEETIKSMTKQISKAEHTIHKLTKIQNNQLEKIKKIEQDNNLLNNQIKELNKQQEERENYVHSLELQNDEKNKKLERLMKQEKDKKNEIEEDEHDQKVNDLHEESDRSKDSEEEEISIKVHQPNHQNNSPRKSHCFPNNKNTPKPLCNLIQNPKKIVKLKRTSSQTFGKQTKTKNDEISSNQKNITQSHVLDDLPLPQEQYSICDDEKQVHDYDI